MAARGMEGKPILVFDLDGTIAGNYVNFRNNRANKSIADIQINPRILEVLRLADAARKSKKIDAIFLLTNNSDIFYIFMVQYVIGKLVSGSSRTEVNAGNGKNMKLYDFFDDVMSRNDNRRLRAADGNPPKRLEDVRVMAEELGANTNNLAERVWFFDDIDDHQIRSEIPTGHYIHITPSYRTGVEDTTNLEAIEAFLKEANVGGGRNKKKRRATRRTRKNLKTKHRK
jgi:hypothetical protein